MTRGVTLVELLVVLLLLSVLAGVSALAAGRAWGRASEASSYARRLDSARAVAIRSGLPVRLDRDSGGPLRFLPDGRAVGPDVNPLTGGSDDATR